MYGKWKENKTVDFRNSSLCAKFMTYYEDQRDIMSDSVRPEWGISDMDNNRKVVIVDGYGLEPVFSVQVNASEGNRLYRDIVELSKVWNPLKQRAAVEEWAKNGGQFLGNQKSWVLEAQRH